MRRRAGLSPRGRRLVLKGAPVTRSGRLTLRTAQAPCSDASTTGPSRSPPRPSAPYALGAVSFAESSFFPVPPDVMLVPMVLARPDRAWFYALICTVASVVGGILGYAIGALLYDSVGAWLFSSTA